MTQAPWQERVNPAPAILDEALRLVARGLPCFPCHQDKRPACPHGFKDATVDAAKLRRLWRYWPGELVGVPTGDLSGLFVVDLDTARHREAAEWLEQNGGRLPDTRRHQTQSGGLHIIFKHRVGLRNTASRLARGVDTRGDGGYIVWWPAALGLAAQHHFVPLAPVPEWLLEAMAPPPDDPDVSYYRASSLAPPCARLQGLVATVAAAREGERNSLTFWAACRITDMLAEGEMTEGEGLDALHAIIEAASRAGLSITEIRATIRSATTRRT